MSQKLAKSALAGLLASLKLYWKHVIDNLPCKEGRLVMDVEDGVTTIDHIKALLGKFSLGAVANLKGHLHR